MKTLLQSSLSHLGAWPIAWEISSAMVDDPRGLDPAVLGAADLLILDGERDDLVLAGVVHRVRCVAPSLALALYAARGNQQVARRRSLRAGVDLAIDAELSASSCEELLREAVAQRRRLASDGSLADGPSLLIVDDDDELVLPMTLEGLRRASFDALGTPSAYEALSLLRKHRFRVLLTDLRMPELDGSDLITGAVLYDPRIAVLVFTGYAETISLELPKYALRRVVNVLSKPMRPSAMRAQVALALEAQRSGHVSFSLNAGR